MSIPPSLPDAEVIAAAAEVVTEVGISIDIDIGLMMLRSGCKGTVNSGECWELLFVNLHHVDESD